MNIFSHNFNFQSNSGPNKFTRQLFTTMNSIFNVGFVSSQQMADVEFCLIQQQAHKVKPMLLRLDGIWFNSDQDYDAQNAPIKYAYKNADVVVFQSNFNKALTESWFGDHPNSQVIHNAPDFNIINNADSSVWDRKFGKDVEVWSCASNWRPHKRLYENIRYFLEHASKDAVFAVAGGLGMDDAKKLPIDDRIYLMGDLDYSSLLSLYKRSSTFVHLAYLDHCPNVVVDAQAAGCHVICSSTGGTSEIITKGTVICEKDWDYSPIRLYEPPVMNFENKNNISIHDNKNNIEACAEKYFKAMESII